MDVYEVLYQACLEYEVVLDGKRVPLWKVKKEDLEKVDFRLPWNSLRELAVHLYELKSKQQKSKELIRVNLVEILIGIAFLKVEDEFGSICNVEDLCLTYLSELITARINCIAKYYYLIKKPNNTDLFDEIILKFPQNKNIKAGNLNDLKELIFKLKTY
ncbi:hypothetical protein J422_02494 [Methanocaldococcus villosus KIN24-T80]|uniref:Uncharacterized protein n=1 Tax=Methanocaldococcus villosus KIN24-T80 TaxID=1069083 RepID=N6V2B3_9EURY|nr:hypothetical protein [Methanocaldococcus villosus]ENN96408.1 hypothetical protein J422_02494 [Methanocaldococcus villosus KIN24-T80]